MSQEIIAGISADALTDALRELGRLRSGRVSEITGERPWRSQLACMQRLLVSYEGEHSGAPGSVYVKAPPSEGPAGKSRRGLREVDFYAQLAPNMPAGIVPQCLLHHSDPGTGTWYLVLEDLSGSHEKASEWPIPPIPERCTAIMAAHARSHATWWGSTVLGSLSGVPTCQSMTVRLQAAAEAYERFAKRLADRLSVSRRAIYERFFTSGFKLFQRYEGARNLTLIHGDAHFWNAFVPRVGETGTVKLIDWDSWGIGVPTDDLAYMMAMHWYPEQRDRFETAQLDGYYQVLGEAGVTGYDRAALAHDYRWSVLRLIARPVQQEAYEIPAYIWWNNLERIMLAVEASKCRELLD